ncbi:28S ribosomal protein S6, mitochondrial [Mesocricetus auratus]|uniref:Small ribosomal subunit protein bS6m n=1 Tax=Mesocricetus auratus TaxID=10036 RepID=A0ABM2XUC5_MESAU|nr:28S ribosomal protein S6, mitochondrial [Mesocricetus auratus]
MLHPGWRHRARDGSPQASGAVQRRLWERLFELWSAVPGRRGSPPQPSSAGTFCKALGQPALWPQGSNAMGAKAEERPASDLRLPSSEEAFEHVLEDVPTGTQTRARGADHRTAPRRTRTRSPSARGRPGKFHRVPETKVGRRGGGGERVRAERASHGLLRTVSVRDRQARGPRGRPGGRARASRRAAPRGRRRGRPEGRGGAWPGGRGPRWAGRAVCAAARAFKPGSRGRTVLSPPGSRPAPVSSRSPRPRRLATPSPPRLDSAPRSRAMPRYELALILKAMRRPETVAALKRTLESLMDRGAIVRNLESLGERVLPYKISSHGQRHSKGGYFLVDFYAPTSAVDSILDHLTRDVDVVRPNVVKHPLTQEVRECAGIIPVPLEEKLYSTKKRKK